MAEAQLDLGRRMSCVPTVLVGDWVYIRPDSFADQALASDPAKMPAVGYVAHKQGSDLCFVKTGGIYQRSPQVFTPGDEVYISDTQPGRIQVGPPTSFGAVRQKAGDADPDGISIIVNIDLKEEISVNLSAGGEVVRDYAVGVVFGDVVYVRNDGVYDKASCVSEATVHALAVAKSLDDPTAGKAKVVFSGDVAAYAGLTIGKTYILGQTPGSIVAEDDTLNPDYPDQTPGSGHIRAEVGVAVAANTLFVGTIRDYDEF